MPKKPNFSFERQERDKAKAAKKAAKIDARSAKTTPADAQTAKVHGDAGTSAVVADVVHDEVDDTTASERSGSTEGR